MSKDHAKLKKAAADAVAASKNCYDYVDLLAQHPKFVIFTKKNRLQVIYEPTKDQIRKRGKAKWKISLVTDDKFKAARMLSFIFEKSHAQEPREN